VDTIAVLDYDRIIVRNPYEPGEHTVINRWSFRDMTAVSTDGRSFVVASADPRRHRVVLRRIDIGTGETVFSREFPYSPSPLTPAEAFAHYERTLARLSPPSARALRAALDPPDHRPPVHRVQHFDNGQTWIEIAGQGHWDVIDGTGNLVAHVMAPIDVDIRAISGDHVWGFAVGEYEEPYIHRFRLVR
jgi:hypothetical protein